MQRQREAQKLGPVAPKDGKNHPKELKKLFSPVRQ